MNLVSMDRVGAADIVVGQQWCPVVAELRQRLVWTVVEREFDHAIMRRGTQERAVSFGTLLAYWGLLEVPPS